MNGPINVCKRREYQGHEDYLIVTECPRFCVHIYLLVNSDCHLPRYKPLTYRIEAMPITDVQPWISSIFSAYSWQCELNSTVVEYVKFYPTVN